jgi:tetratricopeptide (TPR) repeat protein
MRQGVRLTSATAAVALALGLAFPAETPYAQRGIAQPSPAGSLRPARADAEIQLQFGTLLFKDGRYREAIDAFRRAIALTSVEREAATSAPLALAAKVGLVTSLLRVGEFRDAFEVAEGTAGEHQGSADALAIYADALWALGRFQDSERAVRDALALQPDLARARHALARVLAARSRLDAAIIEAQAALRVSPGEGEYQYTLGAIYQRMNAFDAAASAFENYVNLLPNRDKSDKAAWARAQVRFLRWFEGRKGRRESARERWRIP